MIPAKDRSNQNDTVNHTFHSHRSLAMCRRNGLALLGALLLVIATLVRGYPRTAEPAFGLRQLREFETWNNGRRMAMDLVHEDADAAGRRVEIQYDVELAPHIRPHNTDDEEHLTSVLGNADGEMRLLFDSVAAATAFAANLVQGDFLHGHYQDGPGEEAAVFPYHARVLTSKLDGATLLLDIDVPTLTEVFINAKASISVAFAPEDYHVMPHNDDQQEEEGAQEVEQVTAPTSRSGPRRHLAVTRRQLGTFGWAKEWATRNLHHIATLGDYALGVMDMAVKLVNFAFTGNLVASMNQAVNLFDFNYDKATKGPICSFNLEDNIIPNDSRTRPPFWGECRQCYAYSNMALRFEVDIYNYEVNKLVAMIDGELDFNFLMDKLSVPSGGHVGNYTRVLKHIATKTPFSFNLGNVVVDISTYVPVAVGTSMWVSGAATFSVDMSATATIKAGYRYVRTATPQVQVVNKVDFDFGGKGVRLLRWAGREVGLRLHLFPVVQFNLALGSGPFTNLAHIGGPNVGMEASVKATVTASDDTSARVTRTCGVLGTVGANMTLKIGSDKSKDFLNRKGVVKPKGIYSMEFPMGTDQVRFSPFSAPKLPPRMLMGWDDDAVYVDDDTYFEDDLAAAADSQVRVRPVKMSTEVGLRGWIDVHRFLSLCASLLFTTLPPRILHLRSVRISSSTRPSRLPPQLAPPGGLRSFLKNGARLERPFLALWRR